MKKIGTAQKNNDDLNRTKIPENNELFEELKFIPPKIENLPEELVSNETGCLLKIYLNWNWFLLIFNIPIMFYVYYQIYLSNINYSTTLNGTNYYLLKNYSLFACTGDVKDNAMKFSKSSFADANLTIFQRDLNGLTIPNMSYFFLYIFFIVFFFYIQSTIKFLGYKSKIEIWNYNVIVIIDEIYKLNHFFGLAFNSFLYLVLNSIVSFMSIPILMITIDQCLGYSNPNWSNFVTDWSATSDVMNSSKYYTLIDIVLFIVSYIGINAFDVDKTEIHEQDVYNTWYVIFRILNVFAYLLFYVLFCYYILDMVYLGLLFMFSYLFVYRSLYSILGVATILHLVIDEGLFLAIYISEHCCNSILDNPTQ